MSKNAKDWVLGEISKRVSAKSRMKKHLDRTYKQEIIAFLEELEHMYMNSTGSWDFECSLDRACEMLSARLKTFDAGIKAKIMWNNTEDWKNLRAVGVILYWSKSYRKLNPDKEEEEFVDVTDLLFE